MRGFLALLVASVFACGDDDGVTTDAGGDATVGDDAQVGDDTGTPPIDGGGGDETTAFFVRLGDTAIESVGSILTLPDGYLLAGDYEAFSISDLLVAKLDLRGELVWQRTWSTPGRDDAVALFEMGSEFGVVHGVLSEMVTVVLTQFGQDGVPTRQIGLDSMGSAIAQGGGGDGEGGALIVGRYDVDIANSNAWIARIGADGTVVFSTSLGGERSDSFSAVLRIGDTVFAAGQAQSYDAGDPFNIDILVAAFSLTGELRWHEVLQSSSLEVLGGIDASSDGDLLVYGHTGQSDENRDVVLFELNRADGTVQSRVQLGSASQENSDALVANPAGGAFITGTTGRTGSSFVASAFVLAVDGSGAITWQHQFEKPLALVSLGSLEAAGSGLLAAGFIEENTDSDDSDSDLIVMAVDSSGQVPGCALQVADPALSTTESAVVRVSLTGGATPVSVTPVVDDSPTSEEGSHRLTADCAAM